MDLISVVIPVYNVEEYLTKCVESVIQQTYTNLEIILVDDGSTDTSGDIADRYALIDERIKVFHKKNGGLADARNYGINIANGKYITFLDSDDWIDKNFVENLYNLLKSKDAEIALCEFERVFDEDFAIQQESINFYEYTNVDALCKLDFVTMTIACAKLYKIDLFNDVKYPVGKVHEDEFTTYKLIYKANRVVYTTEKLYLYRQRDGSIMRSGFNLEHRLNLIEAIDEKCDFYGEIGLVELRDETYIRLFNLYDSVNRRIDMFEDEDAKKKYLTDYSNFKKKLRKSKQSPKFKAFYELYFLSPNFANYLKNKKNLKLQ